MGADHVERVRLGLDFVTRKVLVSVNHCLRLTRMASKGGMEDDFDRLTNCTAGRHCNDWIERTRGQREQVYLHDRRRLWPQAPVFGRLQDVEPELARRR